MFYRTYRGHNHYTGGVGKGIRTSFMQGSSLTRLIYINCGVFLALKIIYSLFSLTGTGKIFIPSCWSGLASLQTRNTCCIVHGPYLPTCSLSLNFYTFCSTCYGYIGSAAFF